MPALRTLAAAQLISMTGRQLTLVAVPYQVYLVTGSSFAVGLLGLVQAVPLILAGLYAGSFADRFDRRRVMLLSLAGQGACSLMLFAASTAGRPSILVLYALAALAAPFSTTEHAARSATVPRLVGLDRLPSALTLNQVLMQLSFAAGPALAGVVIGIDLRWAYLADSACFAGAVLILLRLPPLPPLENAPVVAIGLRAPAEGLAFTLRQRALLGVFAIDLAAMVFGMPRAVFPALAATVFHVGPAGLGLLYAAPGAGALAGSILSGWVGRTDHTGRNVVLAVTVWGASITAFGLSGRALPLALALLGLAGAADMVSAVFRHTIVQIVTPDHLRGRLSALNSMVVTAGPRLGDLEAGAVAALTSPLVSVVSGGLLCLAGVAVVAWRLPELARQRRGLTTTWNGGR